jgi:hypothetical protein
MKLKSDHMVLALSVAFIAYLSYLWISNCYLYRNEYDRGCWNGAANVCQGGVCSDSVFMDAYHRCLESKRR